MVSGRMQRIRLRRGKNARGVREQEEASGMNMGDVQIGRSRTILQLSIKRKKKEETVMSKKLYKSRENRMICGVCGGVAEYFHIDPTIVRLIFVFFGLWAGSGILFYIIAAIVIPNED